MEDVLCDEGAVEFLVELTTKQLCPAFPDQDECAQLAEELLPVAVEWLRASATPASLCAAAGVCGSSLRGDAVWDRSSARLTDGLDCPLCKHVVAAVERRVTASPAAAATATSKSALAARMRSAALAACRQMPGDELAGACAGEFEKRGALLPLAVGPDADRDPQLACEVLGMCVAGLGRFRLPPLGAEALRHLTAALAGIQVARARLLQVAALSRSQSQSQSGGAEADPRRELALRDNRCDVCKLTVLEIATLLANPAFQESVRTYGEAVCDSAVPASYDDMCRQYVDVYVPILLNLLQQYVQPDEVCVKLHLCPRPSVWQGLLMGLRARGAGVIGKVLRGAH